MLKSKIISNKASFDPKREYGKFGEKWQKKLATAVFGGSVKIRLFSILTYVLSLKPSLKITDYMKVTKQPPPLYFYVFVSCPFLLHLGSCQKKTITYIYLMIIIAFPVEPKS